MNGNLILVSACSVLLIIAILILFQQFRLRHALNQLGHRYAQPLEQLTIRLDERDRNSVELHDNVLRLLKEQQQEQHQQRVRFDEHQLQNWRLLQDSLQQGMQLLRQQITETLNHNSEILGRRVDKLTQETEVKLREISGQVEKRLSDGFEKTTTIFSNVISRLHLIDQAQKKITELSNNVVSLQEILTDKRSRGAFGEVQLNGLIRNILPEANFALQHKFSNDKIADCLLFLPEPTGNIAIDAKFPLENFSRMMNPHAAEAERKTARQQFGRDIREHIAVIAEKYIIPGETADGAMMFIPAEAIFAEIHGHFPELVDFAQRARVWMVSPTTMMAILTTARAVLKDAATRKEMHVIQQHLIGLSKDFERFHERMEALAKHMQQAHKDTQEIQTSSRKITAKFNKIKEVDFALSDLPLEKLTETRHCEER
ncbi:MAG: DNA recombination protein RmuC [Gammaproteobacteria bacterium]